MDKSHQSVYSDETKATDSDVLVKVEGVSKKFCRDLKKSLWYGALDIVDELVPNKRSTKRHATLRPHEFWSVDDVSFELKRGECLGLIGRNGAGKTTLLKMLNGLIKPDKGRIEIRGRVGALIALGAGFNPILTGRENIYVNASVLGLSKEEIDHKIEDIIDFAEIEKFIDSPVQTYSTGMQVRLGFSIVAVAIKPDILLIDEVLAVGDFQFKNKCFKRINELKKDGVASILVTHSMPNIMQYADFCIWLDKGNLKKAGPTKDVCSQYHNSEINVKDCIQSQYNLGKLLGGVFFDEKQINNVKVEFIDTNDNIEISIDPFKPTWLKYSFFSSTNSPLGITFKFHQEDGSVLFIISNVLDKVEISASKNHISGKIRISSLNLVPDKYIVVLVIQKGPEFLYRNVVKNFTVLHSGSHVYPKLIGGFMQVEHDWETLS